MDLLATASALPVHAHQWLVFLCLQLQLGRNFEDEPKTHENNCPVAFASVYPVNKMNAHSSIDKITNHMRNKINDQQHTACKDLPMHREELQHIVISKLPAIF